MKKIFAALVIFSLFVVFPGCPGSSDDNTPSYHTPKVCVAWTEANASSVYQLYVKCKDEGSGWVQYGGSLNNDPALNANDPSIAQGPDGTPYVAWVEDAYLYVKHWNSGTWDPMGSVGSAMIARGESISSPITLGPYAPNISVGRDGTVVLAYSIPEGSPTPVLHLYVKKWADSAWQQVGPSFLNKDAANGVSRLSLDVYSANYIFVVWSEYNSSLSYNEIYAEVYSNNQWNLLPPAGTRLNIGNNNADWPDMALNPYGTPFVTFLENSNVYTKQVNPFDGTWGQVGGQVNSTASTTQPAMAVDAYGLPYVLSYESSNVYVKWYSGSSWLPVGAQLNTLPAYGGDMTLAFGTQAQPMGIPYAAWYETNGSTKEIDIRRFDGVTWQNPERLSLTATSECGIPAISSK